MRRSSRISEKVEAKHLAPVVAAPVAAEPPAQPKKPVKRPKSKQKPKAAKPKPAQAPAPPKPRGTTEADLVPVAQRLDDNLRLLYHLEKFVSLVYYDPSVAKADRTAVYQQWSAPHDPWEPALNAAPTRVARKNITRIQDRVLSEVFSSERPAKRQKRVHVPEIKLEQEEEESDAEPQGTPELVQLDPNQAINFTHPSHVVKPEFGGLDKFLESYRAIEDDQLLDSTKWEQMVAERADLEARIETARKTGKLDTMEAQARNAGITKFSEQWRPPVHQDYLVGNAIYGGKAYINIRKQLGATAKKWAQTIEAHFKRQAGAEERQRKEQERDLKQFHRKLMSEVQKRWKLARDVLDLRRQQAEAEQNKLRGKEYLAQILEQSEQLLKDQQAPQSLEDEMEALSSEAESDSEAEAEDTRDDSELTVEELREKYKHVLGKRFAEQSEGEEDPEQSDAEEGEGDEEPQGEAETVPSPKEPPALASPGSMSPTSLAKMQAAYDAEQSESDVSMSSGSESESEGEKPAGSALALLMGGKVDDDESDFEASDSAASDASVTSDVDMEDQREPEGEGKEVNGDHKPSGEPSGEPSEEPNGDHKEPSASLSAMSDEEVIPEAPSPKEETKEVEEAPISTEVTEYSHKIEPPFLLRGTLRAYQRDGLDWLAGLYNSQTNGILADEMGLGKTIQTISLLAYLACEKQIWGPHLIVVPTSVMLNWEMEFKRFAPGFKVLTYYGNPQQRKDKRRGWNKEDTWHVCITSYQLVIQDQVAFKRKRWKYMILDEAHNIKNFRSQRWQALLNFNSERRLLLTGTPLQNNLVELWSLLYFLMPSSKGTQMMPEGFANLEDFQEWFSRPVDQMVEEGGEADAETRTTISKLHKVLRPYILRRLKIDVEKQMPGKYEHIIYCKLSKRQRYLYDDFMSRAKTKETLASGNFMSILNCLMQLRKVCNHPDLFEVRPIKTSWAIGESAPSRFRHTAAQFKLQAGWLEQVNLSVLNLALPSYEDSNRFYCQLAQSQSNITSAIRELATIETLPEPGIGELTSLQKWASFAVEKRRIEREITRKRALYLSWFRTNRVPLYGQDLRDAATLAPRLPPLNKPRRGFNWNLDFQRLIMTINDREQQLAPIIQRFALVTPEVVCLDQPLLQAGPITPQALESVQSSTFHSSQVRLSIQFPDKRLLQYDCGKLQKLDSLLRDLVAGGHRVLIFTQMTKVLDILEQFLNIHGWRYLRLDGATRVEERQVLTERFNKDNTIPVFILSTRSGGLGINLTGADTVVFYDSDWNPAMDRQCQDRCHRIGQTRDVHIYRFVSEYTIESNILRKATQKTILDNVVIQEGEFTTDYFKKFNVKDIITGEEGNAPDAPQNLEAALADAEEADDRAAANMALNEAKMDDEEFAGKELKAETSGATSGATAADGAGGAVSGSDPSRAESSVGANGAELESQTPLQGSAQGSAQGTSQVRAEDADDSDEDDDIGPIEDWMIRFIEQGYLDD